MPRAPKSASSALATIPGAQRARLPDFVKPCLASLVDAPPEGKAWVHEIKVDGYRMQARIEDGSVRLLTRTGLDWTNRFRAVAKALQELKVATALIDGEIVVEDQSGITSFVSLVEDLKAGRSDRMTYIAFDLLHLDGFDLMRAALLDRKAQLAALLRSKAKHPVIRYSEHLEGDGAAILAGAGKLGIEGIISKRRDKPYRSGRRDDWLKTKCIQTDEFVIGGYLNSNAYPDAVGALVMGYYERGRLIYAGRVGTGFNRGSAKELWKALKPLRIEAPAYAQKLDAIQRRDVVWVRPALVAQIEYRGWTGDGALRHAAFKGLREDKPPTEVRRPSSR